MSNLRTISTVVENEKGEKILQATDKRHYIMVDCDASIEDGVLLPSKRVAFFGEKALLEQVKAGMKIQVD